MRVCRNAKIGFPVPSFVDTNVPRRVPLAWHPSPTVGHFFPPLLPSLVIPLGRAQDFPREERERVCFTPSPETPPSEPRGIPSLVCDSTGNTSCFGFCPFLLYQCLVIDPIRLRRMFLFATCLAVSGATLTQFFFRSAVQASDSPDCLRFASLICPMKLLFRAYPTF